MADEFQNDQAEWARKTASDNATAAYNRSVASNEGDKIALDKAKFAWQQVIDRAGLTGKFEDQWTQPTNQWFTEQFGTWMPQGPTAGQQTLASQQQGWQQAYNTSQQYGQYYAPGTNPNAGQQTLQAQDQANQLGLSQAQLTGYYNAPGSAAGAQGQQTLAGQQQQFTQGLQTEQEARAAQAQQQTQTQAYLQLLSSLRGPADWAKYQQVLGSTPGGMRDLAAAAMGQYTPGGGATTGYQPQAASLQSMMGDVSGQQYYGQGGGQLQQPNVYQGGQGSYGQQPQQAYGQQQYQYPQQQAQAGGQAWGSGIGVGGQQNTPAQQQQATGNGTNMYGQTQLPAPNQIAAQSWAGMAPSQQQMLLGQYESQGWDKTDVQALMNQSLPKYGSNAPKAGTWQLR